VLAGVQSQDPIKSSVECAPVYKEAETTAKIRNDTLKVKFCSNFHQACDTSIPETDVSRNWVNKGLITSLTDLEMKGDFQFGVHIAYIFGMRFFFFLAILNAALAFIN
jgi:hypothetical protein